MPGLLAVSSVPARSPPISQSSCALAGAATRGHGTPQEAKPGRPEQNVIKVGRTLLGDTYSGGGSSGRTDARPQSRDAGDQVQRAPPGHGFSAGGGSSRRSDTQPESRHANFAVVAVALVHTVEALRFMRMVQSRPYLEGMALS